MATSLDDQIAAVQAEIDDAPLDSAEAAEAYRVRFLGRKSGVVTDLFAQIGTVAPDQRRAVGQRLNALKQAAQDRLDAAADGARGGAGGAEGATDLDLTLPGRVPAPVAGRAGRGSLHVLTQTLADIQDIFRSFGFSVARGPEIEDDWHNFSALNFPADHPARDMQDTFFLEPPPPEGRGVVLRTHTSPVQIRALEDGEPPLRLIAPGRVFRNEAISYKSYCLFHQVEGLVVDEGVSFADLKAMLQAFARAFFGASDGPAREARMRFRPSFFPFTEPSAEVDVWWADSALPDGGRWMEILGSGMVDPNVLDNVGVDSERYTGYAFGMGVERLAMLRHGIDDIRLLYENDVRFLRQF
ncbi:phenylalanine--tRNA ligase subunit alpha [Rubrivirga sp. S365]|uniref:Phenylalanine--tRNA ligase alpha subunit n=1 Tax=Rubrivirga litoralis TaxID=3075598 RepID=A0ABU3BTL7_9BACT|nr:MULTISPECIES: phenylalanine--tRNA ligase subunit alpha [unclassified Rubrivirga]MDT0632641.1 phenylalanine--tRNA ligase subunit alpha [Rubrivirga sp. F394]MDT7855463.1 phenylalanine--tRNA ligase subunit alpha [Rubrivirga sp. S365]